MDKIKLDITVTDEFLECVKSDKLVFNDNGAFNYNENTDALLFNSITHESNKDLQSMSFVEESEVNIDNLVDDSESMQSENKGTVKVKRSTSMLKKSTSIPAFSRNFFNNQSDTISLYSQSELPGKVTELYNKTDVKKPPTLKGNFSLSNIEPKQLTIQTSFKESKIRNYNLYTPQNYPLTSRPPRSPSRKRNLRKLNTKDLSPSLMIYELSEKNTVLSIKNKTLDEGDLLKVFSDALLKKKLVNRIVFKNNVFNFDILQFLKDQFTHRFDRLIEIDISSNKVRINRYKFEFMKKNLLMMNVKVVI